MDGCRLKEAAERIGVSGITLKRWLLQGRVAEVPRDRNGWRVFRTEDIARIAQYAASTGNGHVRETPSPLLRVASFFSGIGGFDLGFEKAGFEVAFQCEIDPFCQQVLSKHWPDLEIASDIREVSRAAVPLCSVWVGGFPCQDVSLARMGKRAGLRGRNSGLFHEFARLVGEGKPRVLVIENVAGLLSSNRGHDFEVVLRTLGELGYAVGWRTLNSRYFGVPQSRQRVYIVACYGDWRGPPAVLFEPECCEGDAAKGGQHREKATSPFETIIGEAGSKRGQIQSIAYCLYASSARHTGTDWSRNYVCYPHLGAVRRLTPTECEGVMAFPKNWTVAEHPDAQGDDLDSLRYYALGNAVTPPVAQWLADRIRMYLVGELNTYSVNHRVQVG